MGLKLTLTLDDEKTREELLDFMREQVRPCVREIVAGTLTEKLVANVVANFLASDAIQRVAQELRYHVAQELLREPTIMEKLERLDRLAAAAVEKALQDKHLRPLIDAAVRRSVGSIIAAK